MLSVVEHFLPLHLLNRTSCACFVSTLLSLHLSFRASYRSYFSHHVFPSSAPQRMSLTPSFFPIQTLPVFSFLSLNDFSHDVKRRLFSAPWNSFLCNRTSIEPLIQVAPVNNRIALFYHTNEVRLEVQVFDKHCRVRAGRRVSMYLKKVMAFLCSTST